MMLTEGLESEGSGPTAGVRTI
jgi:ribonuclease HI